LLKELSNILLSILNRNRQQPQKKSR